MSPEPAKNGKNLEDHSPAEEGKVKSNRYLGSKYKFKPIIILVFIIVVALIWGIRQSEILDFETFFVLVNQHPIATPIIFVFIYAVLVVSLVPTLPVNLAAGIIWGGFWGGVFATLGSSLGAIAAFLFARTALGRPFARRYDNRLLNWVSQQLDINAWKVVAFVRLNPGIPTGPINFIFGLTTIPFSIYALSTLLFLFPPSLAVALIGAEAGNILLEGKSLELLRILSMILVGILILLVGYWSGRSLLKKDQT